MIKRIAFFFKRTNYFAYAPYFGAVLIGLVLFFTIISPIRDRYYSIKTARASDLSQGTQEYRIYIPIIYNSNYSDITIVNIPYIENDQGELLPEEAAVFWFGKVTPTDNSVDVRIGYEQWGLWVRVSVIDRRLWYDESPTPENLTKWDSASLFLNVDGNISNFTLANTYRFDAQMNWAGSRENWQAAYRASNEGWSLEPIYFLTYSAWWGSQPNDDNIDDRAWTVVYSIPFQSLGLSSPPPEGTKWRLSLQVHDRDDSAGTPISDKVWPESMIPNSPITWGTVHFGLPAYTPPQASNLQMYTLRNGLNGITVTDGMVGGGTLCGSGLDFWSEWGDHSYPGVRELNVQNQGNIDDWPCFSKTYITFPLDSLPPGMEVITASLTLHQVGNSTGFPDDPPKALNSLIQVSEIHQDWDPAMLSWNNAPQPFENLSRAWVGSIDLPDVGIARTWDVSMLAARAYAAGEPLRLALYSADIYGPHGKYFFSSNSTDWDGDWRPSLKITVGNP